MSKYYILECYMPDDVDDIARLKAVYFKGLGSWRIGRSFTQPLPNPVPVKIMPGYPDELKEFYNNDALIMSRRLHKALQECGVDNMETYDCVITNDETGFSTEDYVAVNLIGLVQAVDLDNSNVTGGSSDHLLDTDFDGLAIDEDKAKGHLMFRLAENTSAVVIHRSIKEALEKQGFNMLTFEKPEEWIG